MATEIDDAMVEAGARAIDRAMLEWKAANGGDKASCIDMPDEQLARAVLEAVMPMANAAERERCAEIAENCEDRFFDVGNKRAALG